MNRTEENLKRIRAFSRDNDGRMAFDDWDESKHPRRPDGHGLHKGIEAV